MLLDDVYAICENKNELLAFLQETGLILSVKRCKKCYVKCKIVLLAEKFKFKCHKCKNLYLSAPKKFFLYNIKLQYDVCLKLMLFFVTGVNRTQCSKLLGIPPKTVTDWYNFCMEVCFIDITRNVEKIGGEGKFVEIDESVFGKRKYNRGKFVEGQWVIGGVERGSLSCFFEPIKKRDNKTLTEIIKKHVKEGTVIVTDEWKGYTGLEKCNYKHMTVNHSVEFVNKETGEHTNTIEGTWSKVRYMCFNK